MSVMPVRRLEACSSHGSRRLSPLLVVVGLLVATLAPCPAGAQQDAAALYQQRCLVCHGAAGKGDGPAGAALGTPDLSDAKRMARITDAKLTEVIIKGAKNMPGFGSLLKPVEVHLLVVYIRSLSQPKPRG